MSQYAYTSKQIYVTQCNRTNRQTNKQSFKQTNKQTKFQTNKVSNKQSFKQTNIDTQHLKRNIQFLSKEKKNSYKKVFLIFFYGRLTN